MPWDLYVCGFAIAWYKPRNNRICVCAIAWYKPRNNRICGYYHAKKSHSGLWYEWQWLFWTFQGCPSRGCFLLYRPVLRARISPQPLLLEDRVQSVSFGALPMLHSFISLMLNYAGLRWFSSHNVKTAKVLGPNDDNLYTNTIYQKYIFNVPFFPSVKGDPWQIGTILFQRALHVRPSNRSQRQQHSEISSIKQVHREWMGGGEVVNPISGESAKRDYTFEMFADNNGPLSSVCFAPNRISQVK